MPRHSSAYEAHQRARWLRHDAHLWIQPNPARFLAPGTDPADVYRALAPKRDAAKAAAFAAEIAQAQRALDALRAEVASIRADMARRRALAIKYSPTQPRVPAGNPDGGQWTGQGAETARPEPGHGPEPGRGLALPMGNVDIGDVSESSELGDLFQITPDDTRIDGVQLAANDSRRPGARPRSGAENSGRSSRDQLRANELSAIGGELVGTKRGAGGRYLHRRHEQR